MDKTNSEVEKFFEGLPKADEKEADIFGDKDVKKPDSSNAQEPAKAEQDLEKGGKDKEGDDDQKVRKNRRHRRLEEQLEAERRSNIQLNERLMSILEVKTGASQGKEPEMPAEWIALYGDSNEARAAWKIQQNLLESVKQTAKEEALREIEERKIKEIEEQKQFESFIDDQLENLEDTYGIDLTSDAPSARKARREFLDMVTNLSPKDEDGTITAYADFGSTFEVYLDKRGKKQSSSEVVDKAKEISARSMQESGPGASAASQKQVTPGFFGWKKDLNIG